MATFLLSQCVYDSHASILYVPLLKFDSVTGLGLNLERVKETKIKHITNTLFGVVHPYATSHTNTHTIDNNNKHRATAKNYKKYNNTKTPTQPQPTKRRKKKRVVLVHLNNGLFEYLTLYLARKTVLVISKIVFYVI